MATDSLPAKCFPRWETTPVATSNLPWMTLLSFQMSLQHLAFGFFPLSTP